MLVKDTRAIVVAQTTLRLLECRGGVTGNFWRSPRWPLASAVAQCGQKGKMLLQYGRDSIQKAKESQRREFSVQVCVLTREEFHRVQLPSLV